jgi:RimJ/RimL family protein N-acetyltransferase
LEPANVENVALLIKWTLDPIAQGPYKRVPSLDSDDLRRLFLDSEDRQYFLIRRTTDACPLGRFYWRAWQFTEYSAGIDWELNIILADPQERGKGYGTAVQHLAADYLMTRPETRSIFAFTFETNHAERRALIKAGFRESGSLPNQRYPVLLPSEPCVLFVWGKPV